MQTNIKHLNFDETGNDTSQSMQLSSARSPGVQPVKVTPQGQCFLTHQELCKLTQQDKDERRIRVYKQP